MILTCPDCSTRYLIDPVSIGTDGRVVKCAKCGNKWREFQPTDMPKQVVEEEVLEVEAAPAEAPVVASQSIEEMTRPNSPKKPKAPPVQKKKRNWFGWLLLILILAGLGAGGFYGRNYVVKFVPAAAKLYQILKIDVKTSNKLGLEIRELTTKSVLENGVVRLTVTGIIVNLTGEEKPIPRVGIQLVDGGGSHVYSWSSAVGQPNVGPWGTVAFSSSMNQPPEDAKHVKANLLIPKKAEE